MYEEFYNLKAKPFRLIPDPRFFYSSRGHKRALAYLRYGIRQGEGFIIITGDVGTGKTLLVSTLFQLLPKENVIGTHIVTTQMQADDLLRMVAAGYGLAYQRISKAALLSNPTSAPASRKASACCWWSTSARACRARPSRSCACCRTFR